MATYEIQVGEDRWQIDVPEDVEKDPALLSTFLDQTAAELSSGTKSEEVEAPDNRSFWDKAGDAIKTAGAIGSGALASAAGGLATGKRFIGNTFRDGFEEEESGGTFWWEDELADAVAHGQAVQEDLTYRPESQGAKDNLEAISNSIVGDAGRMYDSATDKLADKALEYTGSPVAAGIAKGAPDLALELLGLGTAKKAGQAARHVNRAELQTLKNAGVKPTVGQMAGGPLKAVEDRAVGIAPGARGAQARVMDQWQNGVINKAMEPLGVTIEGTGVDAIQAAQKSLDDAYEAARDVMPEIQVKGSTLAQDMAEGIAESAARGLDEGVMRSVKSTYKDLIAPMLKKDKISTSDFQRIESKLNSRIAEANKNGKMDLATEYRQFLQILREQAAKQSPEYAAKVQKANEAYAMFADVEIAAGRAGGDAGTFTPAQLQSAVKQGSSRRSKARGGEGPVADLAKAGVSELSPVVGNSGSAERAAQVAAGAGGYAIDPMIAGGMLASQLGSTRAGQALGRVGLQIAAPTIPAAAGAGMLSVPMIAAGNKEPKK